ncbi:hypothetical protein F5Y05DRAFT_111261 [Hypoxylon sp. FL0543]|nr:hypothetical protein F5Y05DRAFT_111261 [Hypoxylon sp. FL0543]
MCRLSMAGIVTYLSRMAACSQSDMKGFHLFAGLFQNHVVIRGERERGITDWSQAVALSRMETHQNDCWEGVLGESQIVRRRKGGTKILPTDVRGVCCICVCVCADVWRCFWQLQVDWGL